MLNKIYKISDEKYHYTSGYYSQNKWTENGDVILARSIDPKMRKENKVELIRYSLTQERVIEVLCDDMDSFASYVRGEKENPYTLEYELNLYKTILKCCEVNDNV